MRHRITLFILSVMILAACSHKREPAVWVLQPPKLWKHPIKGVKKSNSIHGPTTDLKKEGIGRVERVEGLYDRWTLKKRFARPFVHYADVTDECKGLIDISFALTDDEWKIPKNRIRYYGNVEELIEKVGEKLIADFGDKIKGDEKTYFIRALKATKWRESLWQHYFRYKNHFFVLLSASSFNKLADWGISQIARSHYKTGELLSKPFFDTKGYCSIASTLYYGSMIYYFNYMEARDKRCNGLSIMNKVLGAYNKYSSGYQACFYDVTEKAGDFQDYQISALGGFLNTFVQQPWKEKTGRSKP